MSIPFEVVPGQVVNDEFILLVSRASMDEADGRKEANAADPRCSKF